MVDWLGLDVIVIHNGKTKDNPFGHTAIAVEGYGLYSFGNAGSLGGEFSVNNNIMEVIMMYCLHIQEERLYEEILE